MNLLEMFGTAQENLVYLAPVACCCVVWNDSTCSRCLSHSNCDIPRLCTSTFCSSCLNIFVCLLSTKVGCCPTPDIGPLFVDLQIPLCARRHKTSFASVVASNVKERTYTVH